MEQPPNIWILTSGETKSSATLMQLQRLRTYKDRDINISGGGVGRCWNCTRTSDREALLKSNKFEYYIEYIMCCKLIYKPCARTHKHTHTQIIPGGELLPVWILHPPHTEQWSTPSHRTLATSAPGVPYPNRWAGHEWGRYPASLENLSPRKPANGH